MPPTPPPEDAEREPPVASAATGARFVWADKVLRAVAVSLFLLVAFIAVDNVALVFLVRETLGGSAFAYGVIEAVFGIGMLVGTFWILRGRGGDWLATRLYLLRLRASARRLGRRRDRAQRRRPGARSRRSPEPATGSRSSAMETIIQQRVPRGMIGRVYGFIST